MSPQMLAWSFLAERAHQHKAALADVLRHAFSQVRGLISLGDILLVTGLLIGTAAFLVGAWAHDPTAQVENPASLEAYTLVRDLGIGFLFLLVLLTWSEGRSLRAVFTMALAAGGGYFLVLTVGASVLDPLLEWSRSNPDRFFVGAVALLSMILIQGLGSYGARLLSPARPSAGSGVAATMATGAFLPAGAFLTGRTLSSETFRHVRYHEVGHALTYAAFKTRPAVSIHAYRKQREGGFSQGFVAVERPDTKKNLSTASMEEVEQEMLCLIAGNEAERYFLGGHCHGGEDDFTYWQKVAEKYLGNGARGVYGDTKMEALLEEHRTLLARLFEQNEDLVHEMAAALEEAECLTPEETEAFLARASLPEGFPFIEEASVHETAS